MHAGNHYGYLSRVRVVSQAQDQVYARHVDVAQVRGDEVGLLVAGQLQGLLAAGRAQHCVTRLLFQHLFIKVQHVWEIVADENL